MSARRLARAFAIAATCVSMAACTTVSSCDGRRYDATPEAAVRELCERLGRMSGDPTTSRAVFDMLSKSTQENLEARARRYGAASGKNIAPAAMLAPSSLVEQWGARELHATIVGTHALVEVRGLHADQRTEIRCVYEEGGWRVVIDLPPLPEVRQSPREEGPQEVGKELRK